MVSYRDDQEAMHQRLEGTSREADRLRKENEAMRATVGRMQLAGPNTTLALPPGAVYTLLDVQTLPLEERSRLAAHAVRPFPVWAVGVLNVVTFGLFPLIHFGMQHDRLPRATHNDPSAAKAIGFQFIPYYNLYWTFFNALRLCDRLTLQLKLRGLHERAPRGLVLAACILTVIPYLNILAIPILWTIAACMLQSTVNRVASLSPMEWDATVGPATPSPYAGAPMYAGAPGAPMYAAPMLPGPMAMMQATPEQLARQAQAKKLVNWSHVLGWGGLGMLLAGTTGAAVTLGPVAAGVVGVVSGVSVIVGAIVGQIGRGMQGRAI